MYIYIFSFSKEFIEVELIYKIVLVSGAQQSGSVIHIHISTLFRFFSHIGQIYVYFLNFSSYTKITYYRHAFLFLLTVYLGEHSILFP